MRCVLICALGLLQPTLSAETLALPEIRNTGVRSTEAKVVFDQVGQLILPNGKYRADNHSGGDALEKIKSKGVPPDFAALMLPADDAPFELRRQYVMVMAELEPPSQHLPLIEKLVNERPGDHDLCALQLIAASSDRRRSLILAMARDPENDLSALVERLPPLLEADRPLDAVSYRAMLENWRMVVDLFTAIPPEQQSGKYIYSYDPIYLLFGSAADLIGIPPLHSSSGARAAPPELATLAAQRNETIRAVAMAMHAHPGTTRKAFAILHYGRDVFHLNEATLRELALHSCQLILREEDQVCREESFDPGIFLNLRPGRFSETRLDLQRSSAGVTPYGYLLDLAIKTGKFHDTTEFLQCFIKENREILTAGLDYFSKPTSAIAKSLLPEWVADDEPIPAPELALPAAIAGLCGIDTRKGFSTLLDATESSESPYLQYQQIEILALWANVSLEQRNVTQLAATIREAKQRFMGQPQAPDSLSGAEAMGAMLYRIHCPPDDCALVRVLLASHLPEPRLNDPLPPTIRLPESPSESVRILLASHLFHPGPGMFDHDKGMISRSGDLGFLPFAVINYNPKEEISKTWESAYQDLGRELLQTDGPERFWARITGAYLAQQDASVVTGEVENELPAIKTWPAAEQHSFAEFLLMRWPTLDTGLLAPWFKQAIFNPPMDGKKH